MMLFGKCKVSEGIETKDFFCDREGLKIGGVHYRPKGENLPIAIVSHGFMANLETTRKYAIWFAEHGYAAFCYDFNGGSVMKSKSEGKTTDMSVLTEAKDLEAVIAYAKSLDYTDSENITLMGCSQGGFVSSIVAAKNEEPIKKLVLFYPALCIPDDARAGKMMMAKFDPDNIPERLKCGFMKLGKCYVEDALKFDPYKEIQTYNGEVLIVHGTNDKIVNLDYAKKAFDAYTQSKPEGMESNKRVRLHIIEKGKHGFSKKHVDIAMEEVRKFIEK